MSEHSPCCAIYDGPRCDCGYDAPVTRDLAGILPSNEHSVSFTKLDNGEYLVTETTVTRRIQSEGPRFVVKEGA